MTLFAETLFCVARKGRLSRRKGTIWTSTQFLRLPKAQAPASLTNRINVKNEKQTNYVE
jgi:hypothetical protein